MLLSCSFIYGQTELIERLAGQIDDEEEYLSTLQNEAFNNNDPYAQCVMAAMHYHEVFVDKDIDRAHEIAQMADDNGYSNLYGVSCIEKVITVPPQPVSGDECGVAFYGGLLIREPNLLISIVQEAEDKGLQSPYRNCMEGILSVQAAVRTKAKISLVGDIWDWLTDNQESQVDYLLQEARFIQSDSNTQCEIAQLYYFGRGIRYYFEEGTLFGKDLDRAHVFAQMADRNGYVSSSGGTCMENIEMSESYMTRVWNWLTDSEENNSNNL